MLCGLSYLLRALLIYKTFVSRCNGKLCVFFFSFGVSLLQNQNEKIFIFSTKKLNFSFKPMTFIFFVAELMFVICWLLHPNPKWRATLKDLEENEWVNQPIDIKSYSFDAIFSKFLESISFFLFTYYLLCEPEPVCQLCHADEA